MYFLIFMWNIILNKVKFDKEEYIFWEDKNMLLTFQIKNNSEKHYKIKQVRVIYWYIFYWKKWEKEKEENKIIIKNNFLLNKKQTLDFSKSISIIFPNIDWKVSWLRNYIIIEIDKDWSLLDINKKIKLKISLSGNLKEKYKPKNNLLNDYYDEENYYKDDDKVSFFDIFKDLKQKDELILKSKEKHFWYEIVKLWTFSRFTFSEELRDDFLKKSVYEEIKNKYFFIKMVDYLLKNNFFRKSDIYLYFITILVLIVFIIVDYIFDFNSNLGKEYLYKNRYTILLTIFIFTFFITLFKSIIELVYRKKIRDFFYRVKLNDNKIIRNNIETWKINPSSFFNYFEILEWWNIDYQYNFVLDCYIKSWHTEYQYNWDNQKNKVIVYDKSLVYSINLWSWTWKWIFIFNSLDTKSDLLIDYNYFNIPFLEKGNSRIYYEFKYEFTSDYLPDMYWKTKLI